MVTQTLWFGLLGIGLGLAGLLVQKLLAPRGTPPASVAYECGEKPIGSPWAGFEWPFLHLAAILLLLEAEVLFTLPWVWVQRELNRNLALVELLILLLPLGAAYAYLLRNGYFIQDSKPSPPKVPFTYQALQEKLLTLNKRQVSEPQLPSRSTEPPA